MKMSKKIGIVSVCVALICALSACNLADMEFGGLVGELLNGSGHTGVVPEHQPPVEETDDWFDRPETDIILPGGMAGEFPDQVVNAGYEIVVYETVGTSQLKDTGNEDCIVRRTQLEMEDYVWNTYGISLSHKLAEADRMLEVVQSDVLSGSGINYMCYLPLSQIATISTSGLFYSNHELPLELNNGCWFTDFNADLCIGDRQYAFAGYLTPYVQMNVDVLVYNQEMLAEYGFDIYNCYYAGQWTLEQLYVLSKQMYVDLNANGQMDTGDTFAVVYPENFADHIFYGSGVDLFDKGQMFYMHSEETVFGLCDLAHNIRETSLHAYEFEAEALFLEGHSAFYATTLADFAGFDGGDPMASYASIEIGAVPTPYHTVTGGYTSHVDPDVTPVLAIPYSTSAEIGSVLNGLSMLAGQFYAPAMDNALYKACPFDDALELARMAMISVSCDVDSIMLGALGYNCNPVSVDNPASHFAQYGKQLDKELAKIYEKINK